MIAAEVILTVVHHTFPTVRVNLNTVGDSRHLQSWI